jgi:hypothetical protein
MGGLRLTVVDAGSFKPDKHLARSGAPVFLCHKVQDFAELPQNGRSFL